MRKLGFLVVLLLVLAMSTSVFAKTKFAQRGTMALSGGVSLSADSSKKDVDKAEWSSVTHLTLAPMFGYFVIDGLLVGAEVLVGFTSPEVGDNTTSYGIGPTVAYFAKMMGTMFIGGGGTVFYRGSSTGDSSDSRYGLKLFGGPTLAFGNKFGGFVSLYAFLEYAARTGTSESTGSPAGDSEYSDLNIGFLTEIGIFF